jgi:uncharacterized protein (DUF2147 family)
MSTKPALLRFKFDNFADLPSEVGAKVVSKTQTDCNGRSWALSLYPGGKGDRRADAEGFVALYLVTAGEEASYPFDSNVNISVKDANKSVAKEWTFDYQFKNNKDGWGRFKVMKRSDILDASKNVLKEGALHIDVTIQVRDKKDKDLYDPDDDYVRDKMLALLESGEKSDISFKVVKID